MNVCRDLVLYNVLYDNPFRNLIPLAGFYPSLLQAIVANSALHMSNATESHASLLHLAYSGVDGQDLRASNVLTSLCETHYYVALASKQRALVMLNSALDVMCARDIDVVLAIVLLLIEFELIDCEQKEWKHHVRGARSLIEIISRTDGLSASTTTPLRRCLVANCMVYGTRGLPISFSRLHTDSGVPDLPFSAQHLPLPVISCQAARFRTALSLYCRMRRVIIALRFP